MKANELSCKSLMVGDWVYRPDCYDQVKEIRHTGIIGLDSLRGLIGFSELKPVPLTPEILEKNGFRKSVSPPGIHAKCYELDNKKDRYNLTIADYNKYKRLLLNVDSEDSECFNIKCNYVHELQHALHLCGIEKEIVPQ